MSKDTESALEQAKAQLVLLHKPEFDALVRGLSLRQRPQAVNRLIHAHRDEFNALNDALLRRFRDETRHGRRPRRRSYRAR